MGDPGSAVVPPPPTGPGRIPGGGDEPVGASACQYVSRSARQPVFTVHAVPFRVNAVGAVFVPLQLPLKPKEAELPGAMALL